MTGQEKYCTAKEASEEFSRRPWHQRPEFNGSFYLKFGWGSLPFFILGATQKPQDPVLLVWTEDTPLRRGRGCPPTASLVYGSYLIIVFDL